jgi:DNA segregation ATPase FtsK/SpoIIIE-like protein
VADADPPYRVARLNYISGPVDFRPAGADEWMAAPLNRPLTTGDTLWADADARAELHLGSTAVRLGQRTSFTLLNLDDETTQIRLAEGSLIVRVRHLEDREVFEIDTPNSAFTVIQPGLYRVDVNPGNRTTTIAVRVGEGEVSAGTQVYPLRAGQSSRLVSTDQLSYDILPDTDSDEFDRWALARDRHEDRVIAAGRLSPEIIGYEDLDNYGQWQTYDDYGAVWVPRVDADWAPYCYGHWSWINPWGWTWIDDAPWGFAPFHYGRWIHSRLGWAWVPTPAQTRPAYAPALVAWVGGRGWDSGMAIGGRRAIGWVPLAPGEVYIPGQRVSRNYLIALNQRNTAVREADIVSRYDRNSTARGRADIGLDQYRNQTAPRGIIAISDTDFRQGRPVRGAAVAVPANIARNPVQSIAVDSVAARPASLTPQAARPAPVAPPSAPDSRPIVTRVTPPEATRQMVRPPQFTRPEQAQQPAQRGWREVGQPAQAPEPRSAPPSPAEINRQRAQQRNAQQEQERARDDERRREQLQRAEQDRQHQQEQERARDAERQREEQRQAERDRQRQQEHQRQQEADRQRDYQRQQEQQRQMEQQRQQQEHQRQQEQQRQAEQQRHQEQQRQAEQQRQQEQQRQADQQRQQDQQRQRDEQDRSRQKKEKEQL